MLSLGGEFHYDFVFISGKHVLECDNKYKVGLKILLKNRRVKYTKRFLNKWKLFLNMFVTLIKKDTYVNIGLETICLPSMASKIFCLVFTLT